MTGCISPPELTDTQLWAYLDGQAKRDVKTHLERCTHCRKRADQFASFQKRMTTRLHRLTCPSSTDLGEYHLGLFSGVAAETIRRHLEECKHCSQEIEQLENFLVQVAPDLEISFVEKVKVFVAQFVPVGNQGTQPGATSMGMAFDGLRGEQAAPLLYQVETFQVSVEVQDDTETAGFRVLLGLVTGIRPGVWQAHLSHPNMLENTVLVDSLGNFIISNLTSGLYQLLLTDSETEIIIQDLAI